MHIDSYVFGKMVIDGREYTSDLIIYPDRVNASWWRKEGHYLQKADVAALAASDPDVVVVGTGSMGVMHVPPETIAYLREQGIEVRVEKSARAAELFNELAPLRRVVGAFHLTC